MNRSWNAGRFGFTLMELMVVISIIVIVATMSLPFLAIIRKGQSLKQGASIAETELIKARQEAITKRRAYLVLFFNGDNNNQGYIEVWRDDGSNPPTWDPATDEMVGETVMMPKNVKFQVDTGSNPPSGRGGIEPLLVRSDGTAEWTGGKTDVLTADVTCANNEADLFLFESAQAGTQGKRMLLDLVPMTGKFMIVNCLK